MQSYGMFIMCYSNEIPRTELLSQTFVVLITELSLQKKFFANMNLISCHQCKYWCCATEKIDLRLYANLRLLRPCILCHVLSIL